MSKGALPKVLAYPNLKSQACMSFATQYEALPIDSRASFPPGSELRYSLPCGNSGQYLDSSQTFISFFVDFTCSAGTVEAMAPHFIQSLRLTTAQQSSIIEDVQDYPTLHYTYRDLYSDFSNYGSDSIMLNTDPAHMRSGMHVVSGTTIQFTMPLASVIGTFSANQTFIPLCLLNSLELSLTLASAGQALTCSVGTAGTTAGYTVREPTLHLQLVRVESDIQGSIANLCNGNFSWSSTSIRTSEVTLQGGQSFASVQLTGAAFTSLKHIITNIKESAVRNNIAAQSVTDTIRNFLVSYNYKIRDSFLYPKPISVINGGNAAYLALRSTLGVHASGEDCPTLHTRDSWTKNTHTQPAATADYGSLVLAGNCSPFSAQAALAAGISTYAASVSIELQYDPANVANVKPHILTVLAAADCIISVMNGEMKILK
jgi:hypothetical protein